MPQPYLKRIAKQDLPEPMQSAWEQSMQLRGDATFFEVFANHPTLYNWYTQSFYGEVFNQGCVARTIKELIRYRLSTTHGCRFCNQGNRADAILAGVAEEKIDQLDDYLNGPFSEPEKAALQLADQMVLTNPNGALTKELYATLNQHFDDAQILELGLVMGVLSGMAKFLFAFDLVEKEATCPFKPANV